MGQTQGQTELLGPLDPGQSNPRDLVFPREVLTGTALSPAEQGKLNPFAEGDPTQGSTWNQQAWKFGGSPGVPPGPQFSP